MIISDEYVILKDQEGVDRLIPLESMMDAGFKLFGMSIDEIRNMRKFAFEKGYKKCQVTV